MKKNILFRLLITAYGLSTFSEGIIVPIYAIFVQKIGGDILEASGAVAIFYVVCGLTTLIVHRLEWSQKNRITLMTWGWLLWLVGIATYFLISNIATLFIAQILTALGNAVADPAFDAELEDSTTKDKESYEWGLFEALKDIFQGVAAFIGGFVAGVFGFNALITIMVATATISFLMIVLYVKNRDQKKILL
jgi:predicted MFS family arabinose efflux permease